ncbi:hypothetical protein WJX73_006817 [Symbiochloris irregularis]|uniref:BRCT domain-containing protein n=1 Tax=Symbiochloris irregularis TaxID=706552 RepID=A0AAW1PM51_9CHLO
MVAFSQMSPTSALVVATDTEGLACLTALRLGDLNLTVVDVHSLAAHTCTHVLAWHKQSEAFQWAAANGKPAVTFAWLFVRLGGDRLRDALKPLFQPFPAATIPGMSDRRVTITGYRGLFRELLLQLLAVTGQHVEKDLNLEQVTYVIVNDITEDSAKLRAIKKFFHEAPEPHRSRVKLLSVNWVYDSLSHHKDLAPDAYCFDLADTFITPGPVRPALQSRLTPITLALQPSTRASHSQQPVTQSALRKHSNPIFGCTYSVGMATTFGPDERDARLFDHQGCQDCRAWALVLVVTRSRAAIAAAKAADVSLPKGPGTFEGHVRTEDVQLPDPAHRGLGCKGVTPARAAMQLVLALSGMHSHERDECMGIIRSLGLTCSPTGRWEPGVTHLVLPSLKRNVQVLAAMASGCLLLSWDWLKACKQHRQFIEPDEYELTGEGDGEVTAGAPHHWRMRAVERGLRAFEGLTVIICGAIAPRGDHPDSADLSSIITAGGAMRDNGLHH